MFHSKPDMRWMANVAQYIVRFRLLKVTEFSITIIEMEKDLNSS